MTMKTIDMLKGGIRFAALLVCAGYVAGCASKPFKYPLVIAQQAEGSILVDVVGLKQSELPDWESYSVTKYWQPGDLRRRDAKDNMVSFKVEKGKPFRLETTDPIWKRWQERGVEYLFVVADLPGVTEDGPRRKTLSLYPEQWRGGTKALELEIQQSRVSVMTSAAPKD